GQTGRSGTGDRQTSRRENSNEGGGLLPATRKVVPRTGRAGGSKGMTPHPLTPSEKRTLLAIFVQHWENARHIKNERLSFTNIYAIVSAGILSLLHSASGEFVLEISILAFLCSFSAIGLLMDAWWRAANYLSIGQ